MKNYICTGKGFIKSADFNGETQNFEIQYTDKINNAQAFNTKAGNKFIENHNIDGFIWKPYEETPIRSMYVVRKRDTYNYNIEKPNDDVVFEWMVEKGIMRNESDVKFLLAKESTNQDLMSYEEAKVKALALNMEMFNELNEKISNIIKTNEPE